MVILTVRAMNNRPAFYSFPKPWAAYYWKQVGNKAGCDGAKVLDFPHFSRTGPVAQAMITGCTANAFSEPQLLQQLGFFLLFWATRKQLPSV